MAESSAVALPAAGRSKRLLTLWDLIFFGIVLIQPIAPVPLFGVAQKLSDGYFTAIILFAMFAMMITAVSYGRMAALFPSAGSAYTYVGKGLNPHLGFLAGWAMFLDYLLLPLINTVWIAAAMHNVYTPKIPFVVWAAIVAGIITFLNLRGIRSSARQNKVLLFIMFVVIGFFIMLAVRFLFGTQGWGGLFSTQPFYDPKTFNAHRILGATSFAALTYIGFDGITTLTEDAENPKRNILLATVLVCVFTGIFGGLDVYLGQRFGPTGTPSHHWRPHSVDVCGPRRWSVAIQRHGTRFDSRRIRQRTGGRPGSGKTVVWHGSRQRAAPQVLWARGAGYEYPNLQHHPDRIAELCRSRAPEPQSGSALTSKPANCSISEPFSRLWA